MAAKPKPGDWIAIKVRVREETRRKLERIALLNDKSINTVIGEMLQAAVLAEKAGLGYGNEMAVKAIQSSSATELARAIVRELDFKGLTIKSEGTNG